ncbi:ABC transporter permease [Paenibacillus zanthoxyli]|uniref:ABC transporter permease n=1 Tax=Paenibacillus zanthoxyli TaxID=369399 RepID=UPI000472F64B|nr:ABC transporter permease [Paenibacillus zanthoxyli]
MNLIHFFRRYGIYLVLILLFVSFSLASEAFLSTTNLLNIVRQVSVLGIAAIGVTFVMIAGIPDLSVGSQISLVCILTSWLMVNGGMHPVVAVAGGIASTTLVGLINGYLSIKLKIYPLMVTLATMIIFAGVAKMISGGMAIFGFPQQFSLIGQGYLGPIPIPVLILIALSALGAFILTKTYFGRYVYAIGGNEEAARLSGIHTTKIKLILFSITGFFNGIAGIVLLSRTNSGQPNAGVGLEFDVLTAAVLGGVSILGGEGKISGVITGVLILGVLSNGLTLLNVGDYYQSIIKGIVLIGAIALDSLQHKRRKAKRAEQVQAVRVSV